MKTGIRPFVPLVVVFALTFLAGRPAFADRAEALFKEGMAYKNQGKIDEAIAAFEKAVAERPNHVMAWSSLGTLYKKKEQYDKAVAAYEKATELSPKTAVLWANLGYAYARANRTDAAIKALLTSCRIDHKDAAMHAFLGTLFRQKGKIKDAIVHLKWAVKLKADDPDYYNNLGVALRHDKQYGQAIEAFKKAIALGEKAQYHFDLAVVYRRQEEIDLAIEHYTAATRLDPQMAPAWYDLGIMHKANHDDAKAVEAWEQYLKATGGKGAEAEQVKKEIEAAGGTPVKKRKGK